ncbi:hypothetical protein [Kaistella polysaccharea]|uniref:hypothetical protein n=1 Tax=Kaistella polysaccharea TaxID=2878534 RepID=UPI001CF19BF7|nr:hypothetical protein [Kaistella polysaccharea]
MPKISYLIIILMFVSCTKNTTEKNAIVAENTAVPPYDTIAVDSFSAGATTVDIARRIRMSTRRFQDSLKEEKLKTDDLKLLKKAKEEKEKLEKAKDEKKAIEAKKKSATEEQKSVKSEENGNKPE